MEDEGDDRIYTVVVNDEGQYSIWLSARDIPPGWYITGMTGPKNQCLAYIEEVWVDLRPFSLRKHMDEEASRHVAT
jgi:MbtH protein